MKISVMTARVLVLGAEERLHLLVGLPAEPAFEPGGVRRGFRDDFRLLVLVRLEVGLFVGQGVDVPIATGLIACLVHGYLRSPEGRRSPGMLPARDEHGRMTWHRQDRPRGKQPNELSLPSGDLIAAHHSDRPQ
jgi:hypothetical protein